MKKKYNVHVCLVVRTKSCIFQMEMYAVIVFAVSPSALWNQPPDMAIAVVFIC